MADLRGIGPPPVVNMRVFLCGCSNSKVRSASSLLLVLHQASGALTQDFRVDGIASDEAPDAHFALLPVATDATDGLRLAGDVLLSSVREQGVNEDGVVSRRQVGSRRTFVSAQKQENASIILLQVFFLELVERARLLMHRALELERFDTSFVERGAHLLHQVRELHKDQDSFVIRDGLDVSDDVDDL